jgi:hypothetical protein
MSRAQKTTPILVPAEEKPFVSIPRRESVYCEDCDTISVRIGAACGVCRSYATLPLSRLLQATTAA